jgi:hypothetical protein
MPHANRPAGPGRPHTEQRDAAAEREELQEMADEAQATTDEPSRDPARSARRAGRDAHTGESKRTADGKQGSR